MRGRIVGQKIGAQPEEKLVGVFWSVQPFQNSEYYACDANIQAADAPSCKSLSQLHICQYRDGRASARERKTPQSRSDQQRRELRAGFQSRDSSCAQYPTVCFEQDCKPVSFAPRRGPDENRFVSMKVRRQAHGMIIVMNALPCYNQRVYNPGSSLK